MTCINRSSYTKEMIDDMQITYTIENIEVHQYTLEEIIRHTKRTSPFDANKNIDCMKLLAELIKVHRYSVIGSPDGYRIITNGRNEFKRVETLGQLCEPVNIDKETVYQRLIKIESSK